MQCQQLTWCGHLEDTTGMMHFTGSMHCDVDALHSTGMMCFRTVYAMLQVWDLAQGKCVRTLTGHSRPVQRLHIAGGRLYSIGGRSLRIWDLATYACLRVLQQPRESGALSALAVGPNGIVYVAGQVCIRSVITSLKYNCLVLPSTEWLCSRVTCRAIVSRLLTLLQATGAL